MTTEEFGKELARIQRDSFVEKQIQLYADYLPKRFEEVLEESKKMDWKDQNAYEAGCFKTLLETAIKQIVAVNENFEERRNEKR
tara:strand:- start:3544 stop:3795 length:252 start_codon:yes stop_codon:yes gene_type:complete